MPKPKRIRLKGNKGKPVRKNSLFAESIKNTREALALMEFDPVAIKLRQLRDGGGLSAKDFAKIMMRMGSKKMTESEYRNWAEKLGVQL